MGQAKGAAGVLGEDQVSLANKQFSSGCHFIWTQWRKTEHHEYMRRVQKDKQRQQMNDDLISKSIKKSSSKSKAAAASSAAKGSLNKTSLVDHK